MNRVHLINKKNGTKVRYSSRLFLCYISVVHIFVIILSVLWFGYKNDLNQEQATKIARGEAIERCIKVKNSSIDCTKIKNYGDVEFNSPTATDGGSRAWKFYFETDSNPNVPAYRTSVIVGIRGEILSYQDVLP